MSNIFVQFVHTAAWGDHLNEPQTSPQAHLDLGMDVQRQPLDSIGVALDSALAALGETLAISPADGGTPPAEPPRRSADRQQRTEPTGNVIDRLQFLQQAEQIRLPAGVQDPGAVCGQLLGHELPICCGRAAFVDLSVQQVPSISELDATDPAKASASGWSGPGTTVRTRADSAATSGFWSASGANQSGPGA